MKDKNKIKTSIVLLLVSTAAACFLSVAVGAKHISLSDVIASLTGGDVESFTKAVIAQRLPRTVFALIAGAALAVSGALMQAITRNPVADPGILGVNTGASLSVVAGMALFNIADAHQYIFLALAGAGITAVAVYGIASIGKSGATPLKLSLSGAAVSTALSSLVSTLLIPNNSVMNNFRFWQTGSVGGALWDKIILLSPFFIIGMTIAIFLIPSLNAIALGDEMASSLGVNTTLTRILGAFAGVMLCGATTALAGPIGFVGLMVPHAVRLILGNNMSRIIPFSIICGAILLVCCDVIGRIIQSSGELEVGIVTAFLGAPVFIAIIRSTKVRSL